MEKSLDIKPEYFTSAENVRYKYECGIKCMAPRYIGGNTPIMDRGEITKRYPIKEDGEGTEERYYAGYEVRCGADDVIPFVPEPWIQPEEHSEIKPRNSTLVPGIGRIPFPAYRGMEPYIFISYAHADAEKVFAEISRYNNQGYHIWYDEGIAPGNEWEDEIVKYLEGCTLLVVLMTKAAAASQNVRDEIYYALDENKDIVVIYLEEMELTGGLRLRLGSKQAILKHKMSEDEYIYKYTEAFSRYGFPVPVCYKNNERTDNYEPLASNEETIAMLAEKIYQGWNSSNQGVQINTLEVSKQTQFMHDALRTFCIAQAADSAIYTADYTMGIRTFYGSIDYAVLEKAQKLYIDALTSMGWTNGSYDYDKKTTNLEPLGYRSEPIEDHMERIVTVVKKSGYDFFKPITKEEKEKLFIKIKQTIGEITSHEEIEKIRKQYSNFPEIEDLINDAHFKKA